MIEQSGSLVVQWRSRGDDVVLDCVPIDGDAGLSQYGTFLQLPELSVGERVVFCIAATDALTPGAAAAEPDGGAVPTGGFDSLPQESRGRVAKSARARSSDAAVVAILVACQTPNNLLQQTGGMTVLRMTTAPRPPSAAELVRSAAEGFRVGGCATEQAFTGAFPEVVPSGPARWFHRRPRRWSVAVPRSGPNQSLQWTPAAPGGSGRPCPAPPGPLSGVVRQQKG